MSAEPEHIGAGLAAARQALTKAKDPNPTKSRPIGEDLTSADVAAEREAMRTAQDQARWLQVCPRRFLDATWEWVLAEHGEQTVHQLQNWSADVDAPNLLLLGPVGTGKTAAALLACKEGQLCRAQGLWFYPIAEMLDMLRPGGPEGTLERLAASPRLILDDLGSERPTDWTAERLGILINRRWLEERPTVGTSNLSAAQLRDAIGERTYSRLVDGALVLHFGGDDRRRRRD